jgi:pimeloyl-ACP methyl ester carboxylesterase
MDPARVPPEVGDRLQALADDGYRLYFIQWPARDDAGRVVGRHQVTLGRQVRYIADLLAERFDGERVILWGHSAAAPKVLRYALTNRDRVAGLLLSDPVTVPVRLPASALVSGYGLLALLTPVLGPERAFATAYPRVNRRLYFARPTRALTRAFAQGFRPPFLANLLSDSLKPALEDYWLPDRLAGVRALLIEGAQDRVTPPDQIERLAERLAKVGAQVDLRVVADAGHFPLWERPTASFDLVKRFLALFVTEAEPSASDLAPAD